MFHSDADKRVLDTRVSIHLTPKVLQKLMKYYPKNRNIKNTYKYNRGSDCRGSLSKSISRDDFIEQSQVNQGHGSRSHKAPNKGTDNLLKKSIKNNQKMSLKEKGQFPSSKKLNRVEASYKSLANNNYHRAMSNEVCSK